MNKRTTVKDIADASGVSAATVSRVLNGNPTVAPELVERVEAAIKEHNFRPNRAGRALRRQQSDLFAIIVPDVRNPFFARLIDAFEEVAHEHGFAVMLCNSQEDLALERSAIDAVIAHQVSGVLVAAVSASRSSLKALQLQGVPVVSIDRTVDAFSGDTVIVDNELGGRMAAEHLLEEGWTRPLVLRHEGDLSPLIARERGFTRAMRDAGHDVASSIAVPFRSQEAEGIVADVIRGADVDAVFATTNTLTALAYRALREDGRRIGRDVALVGVDDDRWNVLVEPAVTVVEQPAEQLGLWAAQILLGRHHGNQASAARMVLEPQLRVRGSSARSGAPAGAAS